MECLGGGLDNATVVMALSEPYRRRLLGSTNILECLNQEVRRRERVICIFLNTESTMRLLGVFLMEQNEIWSIEAVF